MDRADLAAEAALLEIAGQLGVSDLLDRGESFSLDEVRAAADVPEAGAAAHVGALLAAGLVERGGGPDRFACPAPTWPTAVTPRYLSWALNANRPLSRPGRAVPVRPRFRGGPAPRPCRGRVHRGQSESRRRLIVFAYVIPPGAGGTTTVADTRAVLANLPPDLVSRFERTGRRLTCRYSEAAADEPVRERHEAELLGI